MQFTHNSGSVRRHELPTAPDHSVSSVQSVASPFQSPPHVECLPRPESICVQLRHLRILLAYGT